MTERVLESVRGALKRAGLWGANARLLAAVSGGSDSAALLHALCALRAEGGYTLLAAHVEHGLRGESSRADAAFVRALCERLSVPFLCRSAALDPALPGVEARAREARYALLEGMADECRADALLTAHHQGDQAETVLLHLLRGSGARGLSGMRECAPWRRRLLVRPLLSLSKADLLDALGDEPCCEDETNAQRGCGRNRLRLDVLPMLERERPGAQARIAQAADRLRGDDDCLTGLAEALLQKSALTEPPFFCVSREALANAHPAIAVRALRMLALHALPPMDERTLSYEQSRALLGLEAGQSLNLPGGLRAAATQRWVHVLRADGPYWPAADEARPLTDGARLGGLTLSLAPLSGVPDGLREAALPNVPGLTLRHPRPGDTIHPFGAPGGKPLRRFLTDRKVDAAFRPFVAGVFDGSDCLWLPGLCAAERTRISSDFLRAAARGPLPWMPSNTKE